ncbi:lipoate--protein ligase family protein [Geomonas sp. RF6]|uniref:lipoate--protein ligase family protein n=1 Tax=Geomonas sp. RF6 TaxID=2897342 RepID=UPI001E41E5F3|nr:biotin/lipoate A/B protein ligase family protein [Geomonas sp. RF6]UFS71676.1 lipoate--protein ligase family protein [Geomonas sp. RF6]
MRENGGAWRLVDSGRLDGPANMALDEALLESFAAGASPPVLRLYGWSPAALSVGRYQDAAASLNLPVCSGDGVDVVRRMTGGGIIYHDHELTYSLVCSPSHLGHISSVKDGFRQLCAFLMSTYRGLGLDPAFATECSDDEVRFGAATPFCFAGREAYDIVVGGRKLGGNAQRRKRDLIFQHGSIPLSSRVARGLRYLREPAPGAERAVSLEELGVTVPVETLKEALAASFEADVQVTLKPHPVTAQEWENVQRLLDEKYRCERWTLKGDAGK